MEQREFINIDTTKNVIVKKHNSETKLFIILAWVSAIGFAVAINFWFYKHVVCK